MGVLLASGLIVGESLFSVALAGLIVATGKAEPWPSCRTSQGPPPGSASPSSPSLAVSLYRWVFKLGETSGLLPPSIGERIRRGEKRAH